VADFKKGSDPGEGTLKFNMLTGKVGVSYCNNNNDDDDDYDNDNKNDNNNCNYKIKISFSYCVCIQTLCMHSNTTLTVLLSLSLLLNSMSSLSPQQLESVVSREEVVGPALGGSPFIPSDPLPSLTGVKV